MKKIPVVLLTTAFCICLSVVQAQNVGVGETSPGAKLTVKGFGIGRSLLIKNSLDDSLLQVDHLKMHFGGVHTNSAAVVAISNKHLLPSDINQLQLVAAGERSGINANGSLCIMSMMNANTDKAWTISSYAGAIAASRNFNISFYDPEAGSSTSMLYIKSDGDIGIGNFTPTEKLDVTGNIRLSGELNRVSTGAANLLPIAFGNISAAGGLHSGSGNFTVSKFGTGWYAVTITGESYQFQTYTAVVTPSGASGPIITSTGSGGGMLYVYTYNAAGVATDSQFHFVVYKQ